MNPSRLDLLIYAHDGRGVGHVSRSVAIGLALRRLHPGLKVLLATGSRLVAGLTAGAPLDWVKLPAYETEVVDGVSRGAPGRSGYPDKELGGLRSRLLAHLAEETRPRVALADHTPQGKHKELVRALERTSGETRWVLGVRGVVGNVQKVFSERAAGLFSDHYRELFWYGDSMVLGPEQALGLESHFKARPLETGYVSRLRELARWGLIRGGNEKRLAGTVSVPWSSRGTLEFLRTLAEALRSLGKVYGEWRVHADLSGPDGKGGGAEALERARQEIFGDLAFVSLAPVGPGYLESLMASRAALVFAGYNSLTDVMAAGVPAVAVLRGMRDQEQEEHAGALARAGLINILPEAAAAGELAWALKDCLDGDALVGSPNLDGAERAAHALAAMVRASREKGHA